MKALMIEDEQPAANRLKKIIAEIDPAIEIQTVCDSIESSVAWLKTNPAPEIIFMDIELADGKSFEIFGKTEITSPVIFITAYDEYAIKAIKFSAIDYIMKPVDKEELKQAIERIKAKREVKPAVTTETLSVLLQTIKTNGKPQKLAISNLDGTTFVDIEKIIRFTADSNYTHIYVAGGKKFTATKTLKEYDEMFKDMNFFRVHNAHLINLSCVEKYIKGEGGFVVMSDNSTIEVSRAKKKELLALLAL